MACSFVTISAHRESSSAARVSCAGSIVSLSPNGTVTKAQSEPGRVKTRLRRFDEVVALGLT